MYSAWQLVVTIVVASLVAFLLKAGRERRRAYDLRRRGFVSKMFLMNGPSDTEHKSMPPHNIFFGHLFILAQVMSKLPKDAHPHYLADQLRRTYPDLGPIFYLDAWPFMTLTLVVSSPATLAQITTEHVLPKFPAIKAFLYPLSNGQDLVSMDGREWKYWRTMFNPGFSLGQLMTLVPEIVYETATFCESLGDYARNKSIVPMKALTDDLAMDVIGRVVLNAKLDCQRRSNPMVQALRRQMRWMVFGSEGNPLQQLHPLRPFIHWYNTLQMDRYIVPEVEARFETLRRRFSNSDTSKDLASGKSVMDLALAAFAKQTVDAKIPDRLDPKFKEIAVNQIKLFLFSGHDTTSSTVCYVFYLLYSYPEVLNLVRAEHDEILGQDPMQAASQISTNPSLLGKMTYTTATIKECMRLFPAASTTRMGEPDFTILNPSDGLRYPADSSMLIWLVSHACHRDPAVWSRPDEFLPERWLTAQDDELHPEKGAWRPFELGPRACIGQELSMLELKIVVSLAARRYDIRNVYEELDMLQDNVRTKGQRIRTVDGERAYQVGKGEPSQFLPCRISERQV